MIAYEGRCVTMQGITVPLYIEHDRPYINLDILGSEDSPHETLFLVDTGGGSFLLPEAIAHKVGMLLTGKDLIRESGSVLERISPPRVFVGGMPLDLAQTDAFVVLEEGAFKREYGLISGHILARYRVTFDYPHQQFMLAAPGAFVSLGKAFNTPVHQKSSFPRIEVVIDGQRYGMLLDTGASCTMISSTLLEKWAARHPDWPVASGGAVGTANMGIRAVDEGVFMLRIADLQFGPFHLQGICAVSRPTGTFEQWLSQWTTEPVVGALAGNVLKLFRVEIDYTSGITYFEQHAQPDQRDMDLVGLTLYPQRDGTYSIVAVSDRNDPHVLQSVQVGDILLQVDALKVTGLSLPQVVDALRGEPGHMHMLLLERDGTCLVVNVPTARIL
jgi:hypothetical protein